MFLSSNCINGFLNYRCFRFFFFDWQIIIWKVGSFIFSSCSDRNNSFSLLIWTFIHLLKCSPVKPKSIIQMSKHTNKYTFNKTQMFWAWINLNILPSEFSKYEKWEWFENERRGPPQFGGEQSPSIILFFLWVSFL